MCVCFCTSQTAHLSRSSLGVGFHPNLHPNQGFIRVRDIYCCCVNWFQNMPELYRIAHYLQPSPTSSPVSRTTEPLRNQGFRFLYVRKYPNRTQTIPNHRLFVKWALCQMLGCAGFATCKMRARKLEKWLFVKCWGKQDSQPVKCEHGSWRNGRRCGEWIFLSNAIIINFITECVQ